MTVKVIHTGYKPYSLMVFTIKPSSKEIGLQMSKCKPALKVFFDEITKDGLSPSKTDGTRWNEYMTDQTKFNSMQNSLQIHW